MKYKCNKGNVCRNHQCSHIHPHNKRMDCTRPCPIMGGGHSGSCEIIKPKPKKLVRVKAWGRFIFCGTKSLETLQAQTVKQFQCQDRKVFNFDIPCTILIDKKHLKENK